MYYKYGKKKIIKKNKKNTSVSFLNILLNMNQNQLN